MIKRKLTGCKRNDEVYTRAPVSLLVSFNWSLFVSIWINKSITENMHEHERTHIHI